jgi:RNase adaptor protein for sRNA GlmZ degradation
MSAPAPAGFLVRIVSFGYLHGPAPEADNTTDVRRYLRDPATVRGAGLLDSDGLDPRVQQVVLDTPGAVHTLVTLTYYVAGFPRDRGPLVLALGCAGGKHRSAALAEILAAELRAQGYTVELTHLHVHLDRVLTTTDTTTSEEAPQ